MGKVLKFLYSLMLIVLTLLGACFVAFGLFDDRLVGNVLYYLGNHLYRNIILGVGIALIVFAIIILVVLIQNSDRGLDVLIEDEKGSILLTSRALESTINQAIKRFYTCEPVKSGASIINNEKIEARALVDTYADQGIDTLGERLREEIIKSLSNLTGINDINLDLRIDKKDKQAEKREYGQY